MAIYTLRVIKDGRTLTRKQVSDGLGRDAVVIPAQADVTYLLSDPLSNTGPSKISAKRVGKNLHVGIGKGSPDTPDLIIEGYFDFAPGVLAGAMADGSQATYDLGALSTSSVPTASPSSGAVTPDGAVAQASLPSAGFDKSNMLLGGLGLLALGGAGGGGGSKSSAAVTSALSKVTDYAGDGTKPAPELGDYTAIGITGVNATNLAAINTSVDALSATNVDTKEKLQAVIDAYVKILAEANGIASDATQANPISDDYALIGANIGQAAANAAALSLINTVIGNLATTAVDTIAEINALAIVIDKIMNAAVGAPVTLTVADFALLGLPTSGPGAINAANLEAINSAITSAGGQAKVDTYAELSALVTAVATIVSYAVDNKQATPTAADYANAGITGVSNINLAAINNAVDTLTASAVDTKAELQAVIDAYVKILAEANGSAADATPANPTASDYAIIGANIGLSASNPAALSLLNTVIGNLQATNIDTVAEINALAAVVDKLMNAAAGAPATLTVADYALLGLPTSGVGAVTAANLAIVNNAITNAGGQAKVDTYVELVALVSLIVTIASYADDNTQPAPTTNDYSNAGVSGVNSTNIAAINSAVDALNAVAVDTKDELQAVVDAYSKILAEANGSAIDATPSSNPLAEDYALIGANIGLSTTNSAALSLLNSIVGNLSTTSVDSIAEINALAVIVDKVMNAATGATASLTLAEYNLIGIPSNGPGAVTSANLAAVNNALSLVGGQLKVDTFVELNALITAVATIVTYADDNTQTVPTLANYLSAGITGVTAANLSAINSALDANSIGGVDTKAELQAVVDTYNLILAEANGAASDGTPGSNPTAAQYALIGANIGLASTNSVNLTLLNDAIGGLTSTAIDSIAEINDLAAAANAVISGAAGNAAPTLAQLAALGINGVTANNILAIQNAIAATADSGLQVDTMAELQAVVTTAANAAALSQTRIQNYASSNLNTAPTAGDYVNVGVTGVDASNLSAINSAVDALSSTGVDTVFEIQALVNAYRTILGEANGALPDATPLSNPTANDFLAIGASIGLASGGIESGNDLASSALALLDNSISGLNIAAVDTVAEINALGSAVDKVMNLAKLGTGATIPVGGLTMADLTLLGIDTSLADTAAEVNAILRAIIDSADSGAGVNTIQALQALVNANAA